MLRYLSAFVVCLLAVPAMAELPRAVDLGTGVQPRLAVGGDGAIYAVFGDKGVHIRKSADAGKTWSAPASVVNIPAKIALGMRRGPRIAAAGDTLLVTAITAGESGGDLIAVRSTDAGKTWSKPATISDTPHAAREGLSGLASDGKKQFAAVWLDLRDGQTTVMSSISDDGGRTWSNNALVCRSPDGHVCECCHPSVAFDGNGGLHVMFRNWLGGNRDLYVADSSDGGKTWAAATKLGTGTWPLNACPMDGGEIAADGKAMATVWQRKGGVYGAAEGESSERSFGDGRQPSLAVGKAGVWYGFLSDGALRIIPPRGNAFALAEAAEAPVLAAGGGHVYCAWQASGHAFVATLE